MEKHLVGRKIVYIPDSMNDPFPVLVLGVRHYRGYNFLHVFALDGRKSGESFFCCLDQLMAW